MSDQRLPQGVYAYITKDGRTLYRAAYRRSDGSQGTKRGFTSPRAAQRWREQTVSAARRGELARAPRSSVGELFDRFLAARRPFLAPGTFTDYRAHGRRRIKPAFGARRVDRLTADAIEDWVVELWEDGKLAPKTINNALKVLSAFLAWCVERGYVTRNQAVGVDPVPADHSEMDYLRPHEIPRYLRACRAEYRPLAELLIASGLRISEALALEWGDIDSERCQVRVLRQRRAGARARRGGRELRDAAATKGRTVRVVHISRRVIELLGDLHARQGELTSLRDDSRVFVLYRPVPPSAHALSPRARARRDAIATDLHAVTAGELKLTQAQIAARHGVSRQLVSLVAAALRGERAQPITRDRVSRGWHRQALAAAKLRPLRLHDLRHTAAATWLMHGESLFFVQRQLGHSSIRTTQRYAHLERDYMASRASEIDAEVWATETERPGART